MNTQNLIEKTLKILHELLNDRGYGDIVSVEDKVCNYFFSLSECKERIIFLFLITDNNKLDQNKFAIIESVLSQKEYSKYKNRQAILVSDNVTNKVKNTILKNKNDKYDIFKFIELQYNPNKHFLTPEHKDTGKTDDPLTTKLHKIKRDDIIARWFKWSPGKVIMETVKNYDGTYLINYCCVV